MNEDEVRQRAFGVPVAQLPVPEALPGVHILTDLTLGLGGVVHDHLAARQKPLP